LEEPVAKAPSPLLSFPRSISLPRASPIQPFCFPGLDPGILFDER
jgi:hypothetical protein